MRVSPDFIPVVWLVPPRTHIFLLLPSYNKIMTGDNFKKGTRSCSVFFLYLLRASVPVSLNRLICVSVSVVFQEHEQKLFNYKNTLSLVQSMLYLIGVSLPFTLNRLHLFIFWVCVGPMFIMF